MSLQQFEKELQDSIHPDLKCQVNWTGAPDVAGIYFKDVCLYITIPADGPAETRSNLYTDARGVPFRGKDEVMKEVKQILSNAKKMKKLADDKADQKQ